MAAKKKTNAALFGAINHYSHEHYPLHQSSSRSTLTAAGSHTHTHTGPIAAHFSFPVHGAPDEQMKDNIYYRVKAIGPSHSSPDHGVLPAPQKKKIYNTLSDFSTTVFDYVPKMYLFVF